MANSLVYNYDYLMRKLNSEKCKVINIDGKFFKEMYDVNYEVDLNDISNIAIGNQVFSPKTNEDRIEREQLISETKETSEN